MAEKTTKTGKKYKATSIFDVDAFNDFEGLGYENHTKLSRGETVVLENPPKELIKKKGALRNVSSKFSNLLANEAGLETGLSLGMLGATHGTLLEAAKQSSEIAQGLREGFDPWKMTWEGAKHGASNIGTGYAAGYLTKGLMAPKYAKARAAKNPSQQQTITKLTMNPVGQVAAEASVFTTGQVLEQAVAGQPVSVDDFLSGFFTFI